jgi:hypothetical protein
MLKEHSENIANEEKSVMKIFYSLTETIEYDNPNDFAYKHNVETNFFIRKTSLRQPRNYNIEKILPENLSFLIDEYSIENNLEGLISDIRNKSDNLKVLFLSEEVKNKDKTYIIYKALPVGINFYFSVYKNYLNILHLDLIDSQLRNVKNIEIMNYNFTRSSQGNINNPVNLIIPQNVNAFKINKFEEELINKFFENAENKKEEKLLILIRNLKTRRVVLRKENGEFINFKSEDFNLKKDNFCKILSFDEEYQKKKLEKLGIQSNYVDCIAKITNISVNKIIDVKYFDINNFKIENNNTNLIEIKQEKDILMPEQSEFENTNKKYEKFLLCENYKESLESDFKLNLNKTDFSCKFFIDVQLVFDSHQNFIDLISSNNMFFFSEKDVNICISPCLLGKLDSNKELELGKLMMEKELTLNVEEINLLKKIKSNLEYYTIYFTNNSVNDLFLSLPSEEKTRINNNSTEDLQNMTKISFYIESKELWEYIEVS